MSKSNKPTNETVPLARSDAELVTRVATRGPTTALMVYHRDGAEVVPLEPGRTIVVGREAPADVVIDDRSLSRRHAAFILRKGTLEVKDLGSTNGTRVRGELVQTARLRPGEPVTIGTIIASVHMLSPLEPEVDALESHDGLLALLEQRIVEAKYFGEPLSVLFLQSAGSGAPSSHVSHWCQRARAAMRPVDVMALYSDSAVEILLPRTGPAEAVARGLAMLEAVRKAEPTIRCGVAAYPESATTAERVLELCRTAAQEGDAQAPPALAPAEHSYAVVPAAEREADDDEPVAASAVMKELFATVQRLAQSAIPVLLEGGTGTGKEVVARAIHRRGPRCREPLVCVNCGAIPSQLVESTLFGHERGAFTSADKASEGVFRAAHGGTVLLDEIGELPAPAQVALLRVLETGRVTPVGSPKEHEVDVRVVAATHRDLESMCDDGTFRRDLLYRLNAMPLRVPPLSERREEIPLLAERFLRMALASSDRKLEGITAAAMNTLQAYAWPGNLRELRNAIERGVVIARGTSIDVEDLPRRVQQAGSAKGHGGSPGPAGSDSARRESDDEHLDLKTRVRRYEARLIEEALRAAGGNQTHAAKRLQVPLRTLVHKIKTLGVKKGD